MDGSSRFSPSYNVFAWVRDGIRVYDQSVVCRPSQAASCDQRITISLLDGAAYLGVLLVVTLLVSALRVPPPRRALSPSRACGKPSDNGDEK